MLEKLTAEQESLIPFYREKWRTIALSSLPIHQEKASLAVKVAYAILNLPEPEIIFYDSPHAALSDCLSVMGNEVGKELAPQLRQEIHSSLYGELRQQLHQALETELYQKLYNSIYPQLIGQLKNILGIGLYRQFYLQLSNQFYSLLKRQFDRNPLAVQLSACHASWVDFCISALKLECDRPKWEAFQLLTENCGWLYPFEKMCLVCDRPNHLCFDSQQRLHGEGEPAIGFADGFCLYAYHGAWLPETYGKLHPHQWRAEWLLTEENAELRRALIQGIGYPRICQELQAEAIDSWQEYSLLKIEKTVDIEPIMLLKMTCPSTGHIHALRVPPHLRTARAAIRWVNWGTDPEEFSVQT